MRKHQTKITMIVFMVLALFLSGVQIPVSAQSQTGNCTISIEGKNGAVLLSGKSVSFGQNVTAFNALVQAVGSNQVTYNTYTIGNTEAKEITGIDGTQAQDSYYWAFFINGIAAPVGVDSYTVHDGDQLTFKYVDWTQAAPQVSLNVTGQNNQSVFSSDPYGINITGQPTALQLLQVTLGQDKVGLTNTSYGPMITSIDGTTATGNSYWAFYVNGQYASVGADSYKLQPNDQISFKLETYTPTTGGTSGTTSPTPTAFSKQKLQSSINNTTNYTLKNGVGDWDAIALKKAGKAIPASYLKNVISQVQAKKGNFHAITDAERYSLGILAAGGNPASVGGYNLIKSIYNGNVTKQGLNAVAYALIALDSANFNVPSNAVWTKDKLVNELIGKQHADGGWSWDGSQTSDIDSTAMVLTALAPYKNQAGEKEKINAGVQYLSSQYLAGKIDNSSTAAQVVIALSSLGVDANGSSFTKDNVSVLQYLLTFQNADGGFGWKSGNPSDTFSTPQGFEALVAYQLYVSGKGSLYQLPLSVTNKAQSAAAAGGQAQTQSNSKSGNQLPNTATNTENLLLTGVLLLALGMALFYLNRRKKA